MPNSTLSFGIEVEAAVLFLKPSQVHRDPGETRVAHFPKAWTRSTNAVPKPGWEDISAHMGATLEANGLSVKPQHGYSERLPPYSQWEIDTDGSIDFPVDKVYGSVQIEVRSPAYFFTPNSLKEVGFVMGLLTSTYMLALNKTTGLHCHVGNGTESFKFETMRNLMAFLWAFEPQLNSLHPISRFNCQWAGSLRYGSQYSEIFLDYKDRRPRPLEGVSHLLGSKNWSELNTACEPCDEISKMAYYFLGLKDIDEGQIELWLKPTIEFRQHAGSVDGEEIKNWIRTTVGIVGFILDSDIIDLWNLLRFAKYEASADENEGSEEPVLAETDFTIIDLLRHMRLTIPAAYYDKKGLYKIRSRQTKLPESPGSGRESISRSAVSEDQERARQEWEGLQGASSQELTASSFLYDPYDPAFMSDSAVSQAGASSRNDDSVDTGSSRGAPLSSLSQELQRGSPPQE